MNIDSPKVLNKTVGHEVTHILENTELYETFQNAVFEYAKSKKATDSKFKNEYLERLYNTRELYKNIDGYKGAEGFAEIKKEVVADLVGDYIFTDEAFVRRLSTENRSAFERIFDELKYLCKVATAGSKEARQLEKAKKLFEKIYSEDIKKDGGKAEKNTAESSGVKHSIIEVVDENQNSYGMGVLLDTTMLDNLSAAERIAKVKEHIKGLGGYAFTAYDSNGNATDITIAKKEWKFKNKKGKRIPVNKDLTNKHIGNETKQEAVALIDELVTTAKYDDSKPAAYSHDWLDNYGKNDWEYWTTYIQDKNNTIWKATLNIANAANGEKILYDISPIIKAGRSIKLDALPADNTVPQSTKDVKKKFSLSTENMTESDIENAHNVIKSLKSQAFSSKILSNYATYTVERMEREIRDSSSSGNPDYANSYITWVSPIDFVHSTTTNENVRTRLKEEAGDLDIEKLQNGTQPIHLTVDFETGEIIGHEGRHRMLALQEKGIAKVAIIIKAVNNDKAHTKPIKMMSLNGQQFGEHRTGTGFYIHDMLPLSQRYADTARELFTKKPASGIQYSLIGINKDGIEVYETSENTMALSWAERRAKYLDVLKNEYLGRTAKFERNGHIYYAEFDQSSIRKHIYGDDRSSLQGRKALIKAGADGDVFDLVENSQYDGGSKNKKNHTKADYFDYFVKTVQIDGKVFDLIADVEKKYGADGGYVYTLALKDNKKN